MSIHLLYIVYLFPHTFQQKVKEKCEMKDEIGILVKAIGNVIRKTRESKGMTQEEVVTQAGITIDEYLELENGLIKNVTKEEIDIFLTLIGKD